MAFIRFVFLSIIGIFACASVRSQVIYYPADASMLLQSTVADVAMLLQKAMPSGHFVAQPYRVFPSSGIVLQYDSSITDNQACRVKSSGSNQLRFAAAEDNGLNFGLYQYLQQLGFRFYQPGTIWEVIPSLSSAIVPIDTTYSCSFRYKSWFISGGNNAWIMDKNNSYYWDTYNGENGHQLSLYQRRNNMKGGHMFAGHRDDIITDQYLEVLRNNPCYVAPVDGSRVATGRSVPDIHNRAAMDLWSNSIEQKYTGYRNTILRNSSLYANLYRNFSYYNHYIAIEVQDGARWANSVDQLCNSNDFAAESDQHFTLANYTVGKIAASYPTKRFQLYAYDGHADVPSGRVTISDKIDIQVVATAFQNETSAKGLLARWYKKSRNISEYHYLNLPQWSGETPSFYLADLKNTINRLKEQRSAGIVWEAAPSKFASLPFLLAANSALKDNISIDSSIAGFCRDMFGNAANTIATLLAQWSNETTLTLNNGIQDNKYKLPFYFKLVAKAAGETQQAPPVIRERINELKAYMHYMVLYFDWIHDQRPPADKADRAAALCLYLARVNKLQIVNSYFLINDIVSKYGEGDPIFARFNTFNGSAYQDGRLPLITAAEINNDFTTDLANQTSTIANYQLLNADQIIAAFDANQLEPLDKISLKMNYTYGKDYSAKTVFDIAAKAAGSFTIKYYPHFEIANRGFINFTVEAVDESLGIIKDFSINNTSGPGLLYIALPAAGKYRLTVVTKYKSWMDLVITTNGNYFYKNGPFLGNTIENYRSDLLSLPGYFYIPEGIDKLYFSLNNSNPGGTGFASPALVSEAFMFLDHNNKAVAPKLASNQDSSLFYFEVPAAARGTFWRAFKMEGARLCFSNTSNMQWYARKKHCAAADFDAVVTETCTIQLNARESSNTNAWKIYDAGRWLYVNNTKQVELPVYTSPNAIVYFTSNGCTVTKRLGDDPVWLRQKAACATGELLPEPVIKTLLYPNPGTGLYKIVQNSEPVLATEVVIMNTAGIQVAKFSNTQQFNIAQLPAGCYLYRLVVNQSSFIGKLVKL